MGQIKITNPDAEYLSCRKILSAVIALAILDCCDKQIWLNKKHVMTDKALDAFDFLFGDNEHCEIYLELLDFDPQSFRSKIVDMMHSSGSMRDISEQKKLYFKRNYKRYMSFKL